MLKFFSALLLLAFYHSGYSQSIENNLSDWTKTSPIEKLYLHLDRENYTAGQTIWFKGYFYSGLLPSSRSSNMYVELLSSESDIVLRGVFPAYLGSSLGQLNLPENLSTGTYVLRAYSPIMLNQPGFNFYKRIVVFGKENKNGNVQEKGKLTVRFFPEGGSFVNGLLNVMAFKATDKDGMPLKIEGEIQNEKGEMITNFTTLHDGMGSFVIMPTAGSVYTAIIKGINEKFTLPQQTTDGISFTVRNSAQGKQFKIVRSGNKDMLKPAYMIGQMENEILFKQPLNGDKNEINGIIPTSNLLSGILQLTIFNKDNMPLAERLTFIDNKEYVLPATFAADTLNTNSRMKNHFSIALKDTIVGQFSVSITDADYDKPTKRSENIYSSLLLNSDIKGYIHNSAYYFSSTADSIRNALDLVMMINGWTRFKWIDVAQNKLPKPQFTDSGYINLSGRVNVEGTKKVLDNKDIIVMMRPVDSTLGKNGTTRIIHTDSLGQFKMDSMIFYDKMKILFSDIRGRKSKFITIKLDTDSLNRKFNIEPTSIPFDSSLADQAIMQDAYKDYLKAEGSMLETVIVKARQKTEIEKLSEQYASGMFAGGINNKTYDLRNENMAGDIFQYLRGRIAGVTVNGSPGSYSLSYRGGISSEGNVALFLDEVPTDASMIESIPISQIAMVTLIPNSIVTFGGGTALAIYTKKGEDLATAFDSPTDIITYKGYTIIKEFYNPNYDQQPDTQKADNRLTLKWVPNIFVREINPTIPIVFYNNDRTKRFKIVAEGVTNDGKLLMLEKIIEPQYN